MAKVRTSSTKTTEPACVLCGARLLATSLPTLLEHPAGGRCSVRLTNPVGVSADDDYELGDDGNIYPTSAVEAPAPPEPTPLPPREQLVLSFNEGVIENLYLDREEVSIDDGIARLFEDAGTPRLGGASGDYGWSSFSSFQRCPYLWKRLYLDGEREARGKTTSPALAVGSLIHLFLALQYQRMMEPGYPLDPTLARERLQSYGCDPTPIVEAWRVFAAYQAYYRNDYLLPLAVEYHVVDPVTKESARYDLIARVAEPQAGVVPGIWVVEHKSSAYFSDDTLNAWRNDGEILGQMMLWQRLKLHKRFGPLEGVLINLLGKQKVPSFHRTVVSPEKWRTKGHAEDLRVWNAMRQVCVATNSFPRSRANCIGRYGKCSQWGHCADREE